MRLPKRRSALERALNGPVAGWCNALLGDPRLPLPVLSTVAAYRMGPNDPTQCLAAGILCGVAIGVTNALIYARIGYEASSASLDDLIARHPPRLVRTWAETNGRLDEYHDALDR